MDDAVHVYNNAQFFEMVKDYYDAVNSFTCNLCKSTGCLRNICTGCLEKFAPSKIRHFSVIGGGSVRTLFKDDFKKYLARQKSQILSQAVKNFVS